MDPMGTEDGITGTVRAVNRAWTGSWDERAFREYIHPDAAAIVPAVPGRPEGEEAYVAGRWLVAADRFSPGPPVL
ncbi:MAG TPA: hypothetical protein VLY83_00520 [Methanoregula sp.]|nr:hypothetical protein [Methanoregula sp.]